MIDKIKSLIKLVVPAGIFKLVQPFYHGFMARLASLYYNHPSRKLFAIGVTGTAGKSTTVI
ncbi:MAG TPA: hypothetical protein VHQ20_02170, partial [Patescibacteria group bacterium]|nr:hypothetical protein [Patescibacteria group bacterium]